MNKIPTLPKKERLIYLLSLSDNERTLTERYEMYEALKVLAFYTYRSEEILEINCEWRS